MAVAWESHDWVTRFEKKIVALATFYQLGEIISMPNFEYLPKESKEFFDNFI